MFIHIIVLILAFSFNAVADVGSVATDALTVRETPYGMPVKTLRSGQEVFFDTVFGNWAKTKDGWINTDLVFIEARQLYKQTGVVHRKIAVVDQDVTAFTASGNITISSGSYILLGKTDTSFAYGVYRGRSVAVSLKNVSIVEDDFPLITVRYGRYAGKSGMLIGRNIFACGYKTFKLEGDSGEHLSWQDNGRLISDINSMIDAFNMAKASSTLARRIGYYCKVLKVDKGDVHVSNDGIYIDIHYQLHTLTDKPILDRKSRLFLKVSNEMFWKKLAYLALSGTEYAKFVQINIERYAPGVGFEKLGFVALGISDLQGDSFPSEMAVDGDIWFFTDDVYNDAKMDVEEFR